MLDFGTYPTPVRLLEQMSTAATSLWIKRDDLTNPIYGGTKVRKLGRLLEDAQRRGVSRIVTMGGLGSHHVLCTGIFARILGLQLEAAVLSQPRSAHVMATARASVAQGVVLLPVATYRRAAQHLAARAAEGAYAIPAGGSSLLGTVAARLEIDSSYLGEGYGRSTPWGEHATQQAADIGLELDATYTAKTFAAALARVALGRERHVLYWHTLSSAPLAPLLIGAPQERELGSALLRLAL
jgi:1-aminocyclopropane-1-carboxylate deaminase/D-cysteine desulfhydrase-like pyridoxal-dependent ACC family enzyme